MLITSGLSTQGLEIPHTVPTFPPFNTLIDKADTVRVTVVTITSHGWEAQKRPWASK